MGLYEILGVSKDAQKKEIQKAYRKLAMKYHPDRNPGDALAEEKFKEVQEAYDILSDPEKRVEYDRFGTVGRRQPRSASNPTPNSSSHSNFNNIWEEFFGGSQDRGRSIQIRVEIELKEAFTGTRKPIKIAQKIKCEKCEGKGFTEWQACSICSGSGKAFLKQSPFNVFMTCMPCKGTGRSGTIKCETCLGDGFISTGEKIVDIDIPAGIDTGMQIRLAGEGEPGKDGSRNGDVFVIIVVKDHGLYLRQGKDIIIEIPVSYTQLTLGDKITIPTLESRKVDFDIPAGTQSGTRFRLKGLGFPTLKGDKTPKGDLVAVVRLEVPMAPMYKNVLDELAKCEKEHITPKIKDFLEKIQKD